MNYALAMLRLPKVAAVFAAGDIDMGVFSAIVYRTELDHRCGGDGGGGW